MAWILLRITTNLLVKICYNFRDIKSFLKDRFLSAHHVELSTILPPTASVFHFSTSKPVKSTIT